MTLIQKIDNFLFRFSYSGKARFMLCVCFIVAIIIFSLFMMIQNPILERLDYQLSGIKEIQTLNNVLESLVLTKLKLKEMDSDTFENSLLQLETLLEEAREKNEILSAKLPLTNKVLSQESAKSFDFLKNLTIQLSEKKEPQFKKKANLTLNKMIGITSYLIYLTNQASELSITIDAGVYRLMTTIIDHLTPLETAIVKWIDRLDSTSTLSFDSLAQASSLAIEVDSALKMTLLNVEAVFQENLFLHRATSSKETNQLLENFKIALSKQSRSLTPEALKNDREQSLKLSKEALSAVFALNKNLTEQLGTLINTQLNVLVSRKRAGWNCIIFGIGIVFLMYATKIVRRPVINLKKSAEKLANGDLSVRIPITTHDEVGQMSQAFNDMARLFEEILTNSIKISTRLAGSSSAIFSTAKDLELNVIKQEEVVHQIATHTKEISYTVNDFAGSLKEVNKTATATSQLAVAGRSVILEMETTMQQMMEGSKNIVETLSTLQDKIKNINLIISAIVKIADQSNLLSLNTAIRAQKTGLKGVGFSVVADKIKDLANQIASTTLRIELTVKEIVVAVEDAVVEVDNFSRSILLQVDDATEVSGQLKSLINHTQEQISAFEIVNQGMQDQTTGVTLIHEALIKQTEGSKQTTHSMSKLYKEIEYLYHATNNLLDLTKTFNTQNEGPPLGPSQGQLQNALELKPKQPEIGLPEGI